MKFLFLIALLLFVGCGADTEKILDRTWNAMEGAQAQTNAVTVQLVETNTKLTERVIDQNDALIRQQAEHERNIVGIASFGQMLAMGVIVLVVVIFAVGMRRTREMQNAPYFPPQPQIHVIDAGKQSRALTRSDKRARAMVETDYDEG